MCVAVVHIDSFRPVTWCSIILEVTFTNGSVAGILGPVVNHNIAQAQNIIIVSSADRRSSETPARVADYVLTVVPRYDDPPFESHFRMQ